MAAVAGADDDDAAAADDAITREDVRSIGRVGIDESAGDGVDIDDTAGALFIYVTMCRGTWGRTP